MPTAHVLLMLLSFVFLNVVLEINYVRMYCNYLHQVFRIGTYMYDAHDPFDLLFAIAQETFYGNRLLARISENWHTIFILCSALGFCLGVDSKSFKCSIDATKRAFYHSANV